jgi:hypothetical protein
MRSLQEFVEEAKLAQEFERGGMNGVATEIAKKVRMLLEDDDLATGAGKKKAGHDPGGAAASNYQVIGLLIESVASRARARCSRSSISLATNGSA